MKGKQSKEQIKKEMNEIKTAVEMRNKKEITERNVRHG